jgi:putative ABC transport system substrate-binding protein
MTEEGFIDARDYVLDARPAEANIEQILPLARELVASGPDLILSVTTGTTQALRAVTERIPIVMVAAHDPVEAGVVADLAHPGGNITGQSLMGGDLMPKQLEVLGIVVPLRGLGYLTPDVPSPAPGYPSVTDIFERSMRQHAMAVGIDVRTLRWRRSADVDGLLGGMTDRVDALFLIESASWFSPPSPTPLEHVVEFARRRRIPSFAGARGYAEAGLLMSYGSQVGPDTWRGAAGFVARIFRGAQPADLPVTRPTRFELVLNEKTANAIGVVFPRVLLERADTILR